ncbi:MAG: NUDIX domain-containing protein [Chryseolinea sp.]
MAAQTAGLFMCRKTTAGLEYFLVHPGGPYWVRKDSGAWSIPKGMVESNEAPIDAAVREFHEETGLTSHGPYTQIGWLKTRGGKILHAWAFYGDWDPAQGIVSNTIQLEYPYRSGKYITIPEVDRASWWSFEDALTRLNPSQIPLLVKTKELLSEEPIAHD